MTGLQIFGCVTVGFGAALILAGLIAFCFFAEQLEIGILPFMNGFLLGAILQFAWFAVYSESPPPPMHQGVVVAKQEHQGSQTGSDWQLKLDDGDHSGWVHVDRRTYERTDVGDRFTDEPSS
jgi:hypothetical protein